MIESHGITIIIRTNPDVADFNMNRPINQIYKYMTQSNKKKAEKNQKKKKKSK